MEQSDPPLEESWRSKKSSPRFRGTDVNQSDMSSSDSKEDKQAEDRKQSDSSDDKQDKKVEDEKQSVKSGAAKKKRKKKKSKRKKVEEADDNEFLVIDTISSESDDSIPFVDDIVLGPLDKYEKHSRFPWSFTVHIMMLILTCVEVAVILGPDIEYSTAFTAQLKQQFLTTDPNSFTPPMNGEHVVIYNITELREYVNRTVQNYFYLSDDNNLDFFYPSTDSDGFVAPVVMTVHTHNIDKPLEVFNLTSTSLGPLDLPDEEIKVSNCD